MTIEKTLEECIAEMERRGYCRSLITNIRYIQRYDDRHEFALWLIDDTGKRWDVLTGVYGFPIMTSDIKFDAIGVQQLV